MIVQKEDLWRPDLGVLDRVEWKKQLADKYKALKMPIERWAFPHHLIGSLSYRADGSVDAVRCMGVYGKRTTRPKMHNKFLIFARYIEPDYYTQPDSEQPYEIKPYAVWSGSFNVTWCATHSFENALYIANYRVANAYFEEYAQILALSEPLDWQSEWVAPEWRIGS